MNSSPSSLILPQIYNIFIYFTHRPKIIEYYTTNIAAGISHRICYKKQRCAFVPNEILLMQFNSLSLSLSLSLVFSLHYLHSKQSI